MCARERGACVLNAHVCVRARVRVCEPLATARTDFRVDRLWIRLGEQLLLLVLGQPLPYLLSVCATNADERAACPSPSATYNVQHTTPTTCLPPVHSEGYRTLDQMATGRACSSVARSAFSDMPSARVSAKKRCHSAAVHSPDGQSDVRFLPLMWSK